MNALLLQHYFQVRLQLWPALLLGFLATGSYFRYAFARYCRNVLVSRGHSGLTECAWEKEEIL